MKTFIKNVFGFTKIEFIAIIILFSLVLIAVVFPIMKILESSNKSTFESTVKIIATKIIYEMLSNPSFDPNTINKDNMKSLINYSDDNIESIIVINDKYELVIEIQGSNKWDKYIAQIHNNTISIIEK